MAITVNVEACVGHPWDPSRKGFDLLHINADTQEEMDAAVVKAKRKFWQPWLIGQCEGTNLPGGVLYKPSGILEEWIDLPNQPHPGGNKIIKKIFVFGSNKAGRHGKGAALFAKMNHGAIYGQGEGLQGMSYGIPTKDENIKSLSLTEIERAVKRFKSFASDHKEMIFQVTPIGCGLAGFKPEQIAPLFRGVPLNCNLPVEFTKIIEWIETRELNLDPPFHKRDNTIEVEGAQILIQSCWPEGDLGDIVANVGVNRKGKSTIYAKCIFSGNKISRSFSHVKQDDIVFFDSLIATHFSNVVELAKSLCS